MDSETSQAPKPRRSTGRKLALGLLALLGVLAAFFAWALATQSGARWVLAKAVTAAGPGLSVQGVQGRLLGPLRLEQLRQLDQDGQEVLAKGVQLQWHPGALFSRHLHVAALEIEQLVVVTPVSSDSSAPRLPSSLALPLKVSLDRVLVRQTEIRRGPLPLAQLGQLALALDYDGQRYRLRLDPLVLTAAEAQAALRAQVQGQASMADRPPYALQGELQLASQAQVGGQALAARGQARLAGTLSALDLGLDFELPQKAQAAHLQGQLKMLPFEDRPLGASRLTARALDLSFFSPDAPATYLGLLLTVDGAGRGQFRLTNDAAGPWSQQKLPLTRLTLSFTQEARRFLLRDIDAQLGQANKQAGRLQGRGQLAGGALELALQLTGVDLSGLDARALRTALSGTIDLRHTGDQDRLQLDLAERGRLPVALQARATLSQAALQVEQALLQAGGGEMRVSGRARLDGDQSLQAQGSFARFSPSAFGKFPGLPELLLNGSFNLDGKLAPQAAGTLQFELKDSRLAGQPLQGQGRVRLAGQMLEVPQLALQAGDNALSLSGRLSPERESGALDYKLDLPRIEQLGLGWRGALKGQGKVQGQARAPRVEGQFDVQNLEATGAFKLQAGHATLQLALDGRQPLWVKSLQLAGELQQLSSAAKTPQTIAGATLSARYGPAAADALELKLAARDLRDGDRKLDQLDLSDSGSTGSHTLELLAQRGTQKLQAAASGGLQWKAENPEWRGQLTRLESQGRLGARLAAPARLALSPARQAVEGLRLDTSAGSIELDKLLHDAARTGISTRGRLLRLDLGKLLALNPKPPPVASNLVLEGDWDLELADRISGQASLRRVSGDVTVQGASPVPLGLSRLQADFKAAGNRMDLNLDAAGQRVGQVSLNASAGLATQQGKTRIAGNAPLAGSARADIPSIDWLAGLVSPALITEGRLQSELKIAGTLDDPRLSGQVAGTGLRVFQTDLGVDLRQGQLAGNFTEDRFVLERLRFAGGDGELLLSGPIRLAGGKASGDLKLQARRFPLFNRSDRRIVLSGDSDLVLAEKALRMRGRFHVDQGFIDIGKSELPQLSDDVVIVGRQESETRAMGMDIALVLEMGDQLRLEGRGLKARLAGELKVQSLPGQALTTEGSVQLVNGSFSAYGRDLAIEEGVLRFTGPINNPAINITAMRRGQEVAAGVSLRGTMLSPRVTLVSEPNVPDSAKLSWLVLGQGMSLASGPADAASMQAASGSLLAGSSVAGTPSSLSRSQDNLQQRVVSMGRQVSDRLYVSVAQNLETTNPALRLRYALNPKLTAEVEAGTISFFSLFYNIAFD